MKLQAAAMRAALALLALLIAPSAHAQVQDSQVWTQTNINIPVASGTRLTLEGIARWSDRQRGLYQTEVGGLVSRKLSPHVEVAIGYRHVAGMNGNTADDENRLRQHVILTYGRFTGRFRIDERFHPDGPQIGIRIRPLLRYNHPVGRNVALFASHESFYLANETPWGQRKGYERMRNIVGVTIQVIKGVSADIGYLNQYRFGRNGARDQMDHAPNLQLTVSLDGLFRSDDE